MVIPEFLERSRRVDTNKVQRSRPYLESAPSALARSMTAPAARKPATRAQLRDLAASALKDRALSKPRNAVRFSRRPA